MGSPNILRRDKGFTVIEVLICAAILAVIFSLGLVISFDFYKSHAFGAEKSTLVALLQKARNEAMNNINQTRHGVYVSSSPDRYVLFECPQNNPACGSYLPSDSDVTIDTSFGISFVPPTPQLPLSIIFGQLGGECVTCGSSETTLRLSKAGRYYDITINPEGRIDW